VIRVDKVTAKLTTMSDFMQSSGAVGPSSPRALWAVAIRGEIRIDSIMEVPHAQCAVFAYDAATGDVLASRAGDAAICDPYFN
jgi:hypothetical protein